MHASVGWGTDYGSLISAEQLARIAAAVDDAVAKGATVVTGGQPLPDIGPFYYAPTVLTGVTEDMVVLRRRDVRPGRGGPAGGLRAGGDLPGQ